MLLFGCDVSNYKYGAKISSSGGVLAVNKFCENQKDIKAENSNNFGIKNRCDISQKWNENGIEGCTYNCDNNLNRGPISTDCPECVCPESDCPECVCDDICQPCDEEPGQEPGQEEATTTPCEAGEILCNNGDCVKEREDCFPEEEPNKEKILCPDGSYAKSKEDCPEKKEKEECPEGMILCDDGNCVKEREGCPSEEKEYEVCCELISKTATAAISSYEKMTNKQCKEKGGKEVKDSYCEEKTNTCPKGTIKCSNGSCVKTISECYTFTKNR